MGFAYFAGANFMLTFVASLLCVCFAPTAAGPGIPEIKAYLNGVDTPNMFGATTLIVKVHRLQHSKPCCSYYNSAHLSVSNIHINSRFVSILVVAVNK